MQVFFHKRFEKQFAKLTHRTQLRFKGKLKQFYINPLDSSLNNHALKGEFLGQRSINVTPDIRAVY